MGILANNWKKAKDAGEKAFKDAKKAGKKAGFPTFKSDFQKTLDKLEAAHEAVQKTALKLKQEQALRVTLAEQCKKIVQEYEKAINDTANQFDGPTTRGSVLNPMAGQLKIIDAALDKIA